MINIGDVLIDDKGNHIDILGTITDIDDKHYTIEWVPDDDPKSYGSSKCIIYTKKAFESWVADFHDHLRIVPRHILYFMEKTKVNRAGGS